MGPIQTSNSGSIQAVLHAQNDRLCLGPIETCCSGPKVAVLHAETTEEGNSGTLVCIRKVTGEVWDQ